MKIIEIHKDDNGVFHRLDGPAVVFSDGSESWYKHGQFHRTDGPALIDQDGKSFWFIDGKSVKPMPDIICVLRKKLEENAKE